MLVYHPLPFERQWNSRSLKCRSNSVSYLGSIFSLLEPYLRKTEPYLNERSNVLAIGHKAATTGSATVVS